MLLFLFAVLVTSNNFTKCAPLADDERSEVLLRAEEGSVEFFGASKAAKRIARAAQIVLKLIRLLAKQFHRLLLLGPLVADRGDNLAVFGGLISGARRSRRFAHGQGRFTRFLVEYK